MNEGPCKRFAMRDMHIYPAASLSSIIIVLPAGIDNNNKRDDTAAFPRVLELCTKE